MERKLTAILSADVKGYSRLMGENDEATIRTLTSYRAVMTTLIREYQGQRITSVPSTALGLSRHCPIRHASGGWERRPFPRAAV
jgi:class 3 adenylate cyclase